MPDAFGRYVKLILERAGREAQRDGAAAIEAEHLLLAIAAEEDGGVREALRAVGLDHGAVREALDREFRHGLEVAGVVVEELPPPRQAAAAPSRIGTSAKRALERSVEIARRGRKKDLRPAHLLLGVLEGNVGTVPRALALAGVDKDDLVARVWRLIPARESV
jgi:ATP-dependent Clp protease ATP-binding subunit ClpA